MTQKLSKFSPRAWSPQDPSLAPRLHKLGKMIFGTTTQTLSELSFQLVKLLPGGPLEYKAFTSTWRSSWAPVSRHAIYYRDPLSDGFVENHRNFGGFSKKSCLQTLQRALPLATNILQGSIHHIHKSIYEFACFITFQSQS